MKRVASVLALVLVASLLGTSDVRGGAGGLVLPGQTTGPALTATVVADVTGISGAPGKGSTSIRVQKSGSSAAALFESSYIKSFNGECLSPLGGDLQEVTHDRFVGKMDGWVDEPGVLNSLLVQFGDPQKAAISDTDYAACTAVTHKDASGNVVSVRQILSFSAVIQFEK